MAKNIISLVNFRKKRCALFYPIMLTRIASTLYGLYLVQFGCLGSGDSHEEFSRI